MKILNLFKKKEVKEPTLEDQELIKMAETLYLNEYARVSNGGGSFENVKLIKCLGIINDVNMITEDTCKTVKFKTDDDWITAIEYEENTIRNKYNEYLQERI